MINGVEYVLALRDPNHRGSVSDDGTIVTVYHEYAGGTDSVQYMWVTRFRL